MDESDDDKPQLRLAHYTVKENLYSNRILESRVSYFHCSDELAAFTGSVASITYLLNISYAGVPSFWEYWLATSTKQKAYRRTVKESSPFLETAFYLWISHDHEIADHCLRERIDRLLFLLFQPNKPYARWFEWRSTMEGHEYVRPCWKDSAGFEANVAFSIACFFDQHRVVAMILQKNPGLAHDQRRLVLEPAYMDDWMDGIQEQEDSDMMKNPQDYFPSGTPLELALGLGSTECVEILVHKNPASCQYINPFGLSAFSIAIKSRLIDRPNFDTGEINIKKVLALLHAGADVNAHPVAETPLQSAAKLLRHDIIVELLDAGAFVNEVADDNAVIMRINQEFEGMEEARLEALKCRGCDSRYKTPLRIVLEEMGDDDHDDDDNDDYNDNIDARKSANILREHGGLSLSLFPVIKKPGHQPEDWNRLATAGWPGVRAGPGMRSEVYGR